MERKVFSKDGKEIGTINLDDRVFNIEISHGSIYNAIKTSCLILGLEHLQLKPDQRLG